MIDRRVPATIVTGFLGAGKTSLINALLGQGQLGRVAALVNDFGALDIDAALVASVADEVVQLSNGCVCCTINGDLYAGLGRVLALDPPIDRIVIETTGVADPLPVGLTLLQTDLRSRIVLEAIVTVVDCANFALDLFEADAAMAQIAHGDIIVFNKTDLVDEVRVQSLERRVALIKPRARTIRASHGRVPLAAIVGAAETQMVLDAHHTHRHLLEDGFVAHAISLSGPLDGRRFQSLLDKGLPAAVFRAKGLVRFDGIQGWYVFQFCGGRASFEPYPGALDQGRLVFIGQELDGAALEALVTTCLADVAAVA